MTIENDEQARAAVQELSDLCNRLLTDPSVADRIEELGDALTEYTEDNR